MARASTSSTARTSATVFIVDPPRTLAFSFWDTGDPRIETEWTVRWDLEPIDGGTKITFTHRRLSGHVMWGVGDGWHNFLSLLPAHLEGRLAEIPLSSWDDALYTGRIAEYRVHISRALLAYAAEQSSAARSAIASGEKDAANEAIDRLEPTVRQLYDIARQKGTRPDFAPED